MPIDLQKIQGITAALEAEVEQKKHEATRLSKEAQQRQIALLQEMYWERHQEADEAIRMIQQVLEEAAHNGKRSAIVYKIPADCVSNPTHYRRFWRGYNPKRFPDYFRKVYDYCKVNKLKPVITYEFKSNFPHAPSNQRYEIHVSW